MKPASIVFVVGNSRSGTTMMSRIIGRHPSVMTFGELHFFEQVWQPVRPAPVIEQQNAVGYAATLLAIQRDGYHQRRDPHRRLGEALQIVQPLGAGRTAPAVFASFLEWEAARNGRSIACDQTPRNLYYLDELLEFFPDAVAVVMVRDPRDVLLSQKNRWRRRSLGAVHMPLWNSLRTWSGFHPVTISMLWRGGIRAGDRFAGNPRVRRVRFEDLLEAPEKIVGGVCDTIGLTFDPAMLEVPKVGSSIEPDRPEEVGIDRSATGRWQGRLSPTEIWICQRLTARQMADHGYRPVPAVPRPLALVVSGLSFGAKSAVALALNVRRTRDFVQAARRRFGH